MKFSLADQSAGYAITAYHAEGFSVNGHDFSGPLLLMPDLGPRAWEPLPGLVSAELLGGWLQWTPEIIILGTGARQVFPDMQQLLPILQQHIGVEVMDTAAACRTYNILHSEERRVLAALLPLG